MDQREREALLVRLTEGLRGAGSWCGETHLQKAAYFLQDLTAVPLGYDFMLYKHGPFDFELRSEIRELIGYEMLAVETQPPPWGPRIVGTEAGNELVSAYTEAVRSYSQEIDFVVDVLGSSGAARLEKLGTALWYLVRGNGETRDHKAQRIHERKPHISVDEANDALDEVEALQNKWRTAA